MSSVKPLVILRTGDASPGVAERRGQFASWIQREVGSAWHGRWVEHDVRRDVPLPCAHSAAGFIITGSSHSVTERARWMLRTEDLVRRAHHIGTPLFGICFGHQIIGQALGGEVQKNPRGREIGTIRVRLRPGAAGDPVLDGIPSAFAANHTHVDSVTTLPPRARLLAETDREKHAAYAVGDRTKCVQFHPEFDADVMRGYVKARAHLIDAEGADAKAIYASVRTAPDSASILRNFVRTVVNGNGVGWR
jgi:GMP synthase (glutamine-hydrolysing)